MRAVQSQWEFPYLCPVPTLIPQYMVVTDREAGGDAYPNLSFTLLSTIITTNFLSMRGNITFPNPGTND